jgi:hypothetical protein
MGSLNQLLKAVSKFSPTALLERIKTTVLWRVTSYSLSGKIKMLVTTYSQRHILKDFQKQ